MPLPYNRYIQYKKQFGKGDIEIASYKYEGREFQVFLGHLDLFEASVDERLITGSSRRILEQRIRDRLGKDRLGGMKGNRPERAFCPTVRIDSSPHYRFALTRYWVTPADGGMSNDMYKCTWNTPPELRCKKMTYSPDALPVGLAELPFVNTAEKGWVYYGLFQERLWTVFMKLGETLSYTQERNGNSIISYIACLDLLSPPNDVYYNDIYEELYRRMLAS